MIQICTNCFAVNFLYSGLVFIVTFYTALHHTLTQPNLLGGSDFAFPPTGVQSGVRFQARHSFILHRANTCQIMRYIEG